MKPIVVADASPFICMEKEPQYFSYFSQLFQKIFIPENVAKELTLKTPLKINQYLKRYSLIELVVVEQNITLEPFARNHMPPLGKGEAEAISLAFQKNISLVIDDKKARNYANRHGVSAYRTGAFVVLAYHQGELDHIGAVAMLDTMQRINILDQKQYQLLLRDLSMR